MAALTYSGISSASIGRLALYRDVALRFKSYGAQWIMSGEIASALGINAAQVRKDMSFLRIKGKRKAGYHVGTLLAEYEKCLGGGSGSHDVVVAGMCIGGYSLIDEKAFARSHIRIAAVFDDEMKQGSLARRPVGIPVLPSTQLIPFITEHKIRFGIIASKAEFAQRIADTMIIAGIEGILCLSPVEIKVPRHCIARTVNVAHEMEKIIYFATHSVQKRRED